MYLKSIRSIILCAALALSFASLRDSDSTAYAAASTDKSKAAADTPDDPEQTGETDTPKSAKKLAEAKLPKGRYVIRPYTSDTRAVTVQRSSKKSGANLYLYYCDMASNQLFDIAYDSKGRALIKNVKSKKYMSVLGKKAKKGVNVVQAAKSSSKSQRWILESASTKNGQNVFRVRSALSKKYYLQLAGGKDRNASNIRIWTKNKSNAEKFIFVNTKSKAEPGVEPVIASGIYKIGSALSSSLSITLPGDSMKNNAVPALQKRSNSLSQLFMFTYKDGYYQIRSLVSGKSITVKNGSVLARAPAVQYSDTNKSYQRFSIVESPGGTYQIMVKTGGLALRVTSGIAASGRALETWYLSSAKSQRFTLTPAGNVKLSQEVYSISPYTKVGLNLSFESADTNSGASAEFVDDNRSFAQKFRIDKEIGGAYSIKDMDAQLLLTASGSNVVQTKIQSGLPSDNQLWYTDLTVGGMRFISKSTGKALQLTGSKGNYSAKLAAPSNSTKQAFLPEKIALFDTGQYQLTNKAGDKSLEVAGASFFSLAELQTGESDGSGTQAWFVKTNSDGTMTIKNQRSGKPAEANASERNANVRQNASSGKKAQKWTLEECGSGWFRLRSEAVNSAYLDANTEADEAGKSSVRTIANATGATIDTQMWRFTPVKVVKAGPAMPKDAADAVEKEARRHLGKRYVFGTSGPTTFDCSGYVYYVLNKSGVKEVTRVTAQDIYNSCVKIPAKDAKRGDIIFFKDTYKTDRTVTHLGFYLGDGKMIHAGSPVQVSNVNSKYYTAHFYAYGRIA